MADANIPEWKRKHLAEQERRKKEKEEEEKRQQAEAEKVKQQREEEKKLQEEALLKQEEERKQKAEEERKKKQAELEERKKLFAGAAVQQERSKVLTDLKEATKPETKGVVSPRFGAAAQKDASPRGPVSPRNNVASPRTFGSTGGAPKDPLPSPGGAPKDPLPSPGGAPKDPLPSPGGAPKDPLPSPSPSSPFGPTVGGGAPKTSPFGPTVGGVPKSSLGSSGGPPKDPLPTVDSTPKSNDNIPAWKREQLEREEKRKQQEAQEALLKKQKLAEISGTTEKPQDEPSSPPTSSEASPLTSSGTISKPKRNVRAPTSNPIENAANLASATQVASPQTRVYKPAGGISLAAAGAAAAQKRRNNNPEDDNEGQWGKGEDTPDLFRKHYEPETGAKPIGIGMFDVGAMRSSLKKTEGIAGETHK
eukprot:TRINITY_DN806_c0_g1_i3.p1 TRINITY_DN806_c0_g1~~TRINITY_DN806_c0_g1_i3.p1  ORF type:complete len:421 (+),score=180.82 TRINITY_DN806_c0_g1_i3:28-1290(+)